MDIFNEYIVKHKKTSSDSLKLVGIIFGTFIACILVSVLSLIIIPALASISVFLLVAVAYGGIYLTNQLNVEYEYIQTNNEIDIDKIVSKKSRKRVITIDFKEIEICASVKSSEHKYEYENTGNIQRTYDCTGDGVSGVYFVDIPVEGGKNRVLFQPPVKMIENAQKFNPRKIFI